MVATLEASPELQLEQEQSKPELTPVSDRAEIIKVPGLIDMHVHLREPGATYKEDIASGTLAAIAAGNIAVYDMTNNPSEDPDNPYKNRTDTLPNVCLKRNLASVKANCDFGLYGEFNPASARFRFERRRENNQYVPKNPDGSDNLLYEIPYIAPLVNGFKFYVEITQGNPEAQQVGEFIEAAERIHQVAPNKIIAAHVEDDTAEEMMYKVAVELGHPFHLPHANNRYLVDTALNLIENKNADITIGYCPHYLFMTEEDDVPRLGWRARMKPKLSSLEDQEYLWRNIDNPHVMFETDHAPHTNEEKNKANSENPSGEPSGTSCFGVPGLDSALPLYLQAWRDGRISLEQIFDNGFYKPAKRMGYKIDRSTEVTVALDQYEFSESDVRSKCGWSPYIGRTVTGRVVQVDLRGKTVYQNGQVMNKGQAVVLLNNN